MNSLICYKINNLRPFYPTLIQFLAKVMIFLYLKPSFLSKFVQIVLNLTVNDYLASHLVLTVTKHGSNCYKFNIYSSISHYCSIFWYITLHNAYNQLLDWLGKRVKIVKWLELYNLLQNQQFRAILQYFINITYLFKARWYLWSISIKRICFIMWYLTCVW